jgi:hypothetical protein
VAGVVLSTKFLYTLIQGEKSALSNHVLRGSLGCFMLDVVLATYDAILLKDIIIEIDKQSAPVLPSTSPPTTSFSITFRTIATMTPPATPHLPPQPPLSPISLPRMSPFPTSFSSIVFVPQLEDEGVIYGVV